jgi:hypothetical protein
MAWLRVDDRARDHEKMLALERLVAYDPILRDAVFGGLTAMGTWAASFYTDCFLPEPLIRRQWGDRGPELIEIARKARMVTRKTKHPTYGAGWLLVTDDGLWHMVSREEMERSRAARRRAPGKDVQLRVVLRDGDQCRYCAVPVNPNDHKSGRGRQYDHVDPDGPGDVDNVVIACKDCNGKKSGRTPTEAGMALLLEPRARGEAPIYGDRTIRELVAEALLPPTALPTTDEEALDPDRHASSAQRALPATTQAREQRTARPAEPDDEQRPARPPANRRGGRRAPP